MKSKHDWWANQLWLYEDIKVYFYPKIIFSYVKEMHFSSPLHQMSEKMFQKVKK